jgi:hypothetical protein
VAEVQGLQVLRGGKAAELIEYPLFPRDVCPDQWWPDVDDYPTDDCTDQRHPPDMPDLQGWDRLSAKPGRDIAQVISELARQSGIYVIFGQSHQKGKSDHTPDPAIAGWQVNGYWVDEHQYHQPAYAMDFADPTVETEQTRADILAWKKKRNTGPPTEKWIKRGRGKK